MTFQSFEIFQIVMKIAHFNIHTYIALSTTTSTFGEKNSTRESGPWQVWTQNRRRGRRLRRANSIFPTESYAEEQSAFDVSK